MKVLFVTSESYPFIKTGGLGDVACSLPKALKKLGADVRVVMPKYLQIVEFIKQQMEPLDEFTVPVGWRNQYCGIERYVSEGVEYYFVDNEYYFKRENAYGYFDDAERFAFFSRAVIEFIKRRIFVPDVIHLNDWHTALVPAYLKSEDMEPVDVSALRTMFTIHNLQYQGRFAPEVFYDITGLPHEMMSDEGLEFFGDVNFMKGAINYSDMVTTVSPSYAQEIRMPYYGENLDGLLRKREEVLHGILNGVDYELYDPKTDPALFANYDENSLEKKAENKLKLQQMLGLPEDKDIPIIGMVTRLVSQKGIDLVERVLGEVLAHKVQFVIIGTGDEKYHASMNYYGMTYPEKCAVRIQFDATLAQRIYAGADLFLMPSQFEPCGIGQLIALKYGTLPIVRETGGLRDTVIPYNQATGEGNGFSFTNYNAHDMLHVIEYALSVYEDKGVWKNLMLQAMNRDFSWNKSAKEYLKRYRELMEMNK
ncbi:MAG: glycogen synthase GlgA [Peptostreptococcaceae bacterium]|nr:glycogen synthase GlgA [Peptostreptococcaceae bacterium]